MKSRGFAGYTILEVMIVLAVSAALFFSVVGLLSGRQASTETTQAVRDIESKIQGVASDVASGFVPNGYSCNAVASGQPHLSTTIAGGGENAGCIFLGKAINFNDNSLSILTVLGRQYVGGLASPDVSSLTEASPVSVTNDPDVTEIYSYRYGVKITKIVQIVGGAPVGEIAFLNQLGGASRSSSPVTGGRAVLLYGINGTSPNGDNSATAGSHLTAANLTPINGGVRICMAVGDKIASVTVGAFGSQSSTLVTIYGTSSNEC